MARLSNPRVFIWPAFRFERGEALTPVIQMQRPTASEVFACNVRALSSPPFESLGEYERSEFTEVRLDPTDTPVVLLTGLQPDIPIFWHLDLLAKNKAQCDEAVFAAYWDSRRTDELSYLVFGKGSIFSSFMSVRGRGRLLDLVLYFFCFETEVSDESIFRRVLISLETQGIVRRNWEELMSVVDLQLGGGRVSFCDEIRARFRSVADVLGALERSMCRVKRG
jgi:hypothetical protein